MHTLTFLEDLAVVMIVAGVVTVVFQKLRQPVVLGYMIAGIIIGPHTPPFPLITDQKAIETLAELGIIFLMFSLGLEFSLRRLRRVGVASLLAALLEIVMMLGAGYAIGRAFGWSEIDSMFLGAMIAISSTTIIVKALQELGRTKEEASQLIFGILIVEDLVGIAMIAFLTGFATSGRVDPAEILLTIGRLAAFVGILVLPGLLIVPLLLSAIARLRRDEMLLISVLGLCFGVSLLSAKLGYSVALGAFIIGALIAESRESGRVQGLTEPIRHMFSAVFFVAIGLLIDPRLIGTHAVPIVAISLAIVVGKVLTCALGALLCGRDIRTSLRVGMGLAQIGEFSFIIAALGISLRVTGEFLYPIVVCVSAITTFLTPYMMRWSDPFAGALQRTAPRSVLAAIELYGTHVRRLGESTEPPAGARLLRRLALRLLMNMGIIMAVFLSARAAWPKMSVSLARFPDWLGGERTFLWGSALVLSLPVLVVAFRNLRALGTVLAGMSVPRREPHEQADTSRAIISTTVILAGSIGITIVVLLLSSAILPPWPALVALLLVLTGATVFAWRPVAALYERAALAFHAPIDSIAAQHGDQPAPLYDLPHEMELERVSIPAAARALGRRIRELEIRSRTGASVVAIGRGGQRVVNPSPDEELQAGDDVFLLGDAFQRKSARELLATSTPPRSTPGTGG
ncbi:MAG TPA: cation:proton antiporter [Candidatus Polarisedimenticolia bacterium]|jgi:CPA2 family monovalent cation:H+ antiporter-2|nr:cation:proton antiporter [Candidatus Polarisedimenticolia bacterium]